MIQLRLPDRQSCGKQDRLLLVWFSSMNAQAEYPTNS
jgi:hypothetical protein